MSQVPASAPGRKRRRRTLWLSLVVVGALVLVAGFVVSQLPRRYPRNPAEPPSLEAFARPDVAGCAAPADAISGANGRQCRFLVMRDTSGFLREADDSLRKEQVWRASTGLPGPLPPVTMLAISGGGDSGAFGAGLLVGWTEAGTRPEFKVVTGISTGALTAPFAFLGSRYDGELKALYTEVSQRDIFTSRGPLGAIVSDAMSDTTPLYRLVERHVDRPLLDAIAAEYAKGRLLLIGTCDLDSVEPVVWNMTAIAASKDPRALILFRKILLASASIPGAFPPVMIDVEANGRRYQEMHVDGGAAAQVFLYPAQSVNLAKAAAALGVERQRTLYVIRNARLDADWASVDRSTLPIATRAVRSLMHMQGIGDLYRIYVLAERDHIAFNLAYVPPTFAVPHREQFDTRYMQALFATARAAARAGYPWEKYPPGYAAPIMAAQRQTQDEAHR